MLLPALYTNEQYLVKLIQPFALLMGSELFVYEFANTWSVHFTNFYHCQTFPLTIQWLKLRGPTPNLAVQAAMIP